MTAHSLTDFDYQLPAHLIAQQPATERTASRLLRVLRDDVVDQTFADVLALLQPNDCLVINDTRVVKARLFGSKASGGKVEIMIDRILGDCEAYAMVRASKSPKEGAIITVAGHAVTVLGRVGQQFHLRFACALLPLLEAHGALPLPPYIHHLPDQTDDHRYQTVYAAKDKPGAVAAPTAGLHFDAALLAALNHKGVKIARVTLHVGAGTFAPVRTENIAAHQMHSEWFEVPQATVDLIAAAKAQGGRCVAVGTTSLRSLESAARGGILQASHGDTNLFIRPGFKFQVVDALITNFHLPKSTLMMLVSALAGTRRIRAAYAHAVAQQYRFFSYGDAMFLENFSAIPDA